MFIKLNIYEKLKELKLNYYILNASDCKWVLINMGHILYFGAKSLRNLKAL